MGNYNQKEINEKRKHYCIDDNQCSELKRKLNQMSTSEDTIPRILLATLLLTEEMFPGKRIHQTQMTDVTGFTVKQVNYNMDSVRKEALNKHNKIISNERGLGYKMANTSEAIMEITKSEKRAISHIISGNDKIEQSDYDFEAIKYVSTEHYLLYMEVSASNQHFKATANVHNDRIDAAYEKVKHLSDKAIDETSKPTFN